jgi:hypothetical protein
MARKKRTVMNPWGRDDLSAERAVLLALFVQPQDAAAIARKTGLRNADVTTALQQLMDESERTSYATCRDCESASRFHANANA